MRGQGCTAKTVVEASNLMTAHETIATLNAQKSRHEFHAVFALVKKNGIALQNNLTVPFESQMMALRSSLTNLFVIDRRDVGSLHLGRRGTLLLLLWVPRGVVIRS